MSDPLLSVQGLRKRFNGFLAVDGVSFEVSHGEIFGLLGPNGAGKTTTIRSVMDIIKAEEGQVTILGNSPADARSRVGYLPEERGLYRDMRVHEVLVYLAQLKGVDRSTAQKNAETWLERVDLADRHGSRVKELSRGMQQKLQFIASLIHGPDLLILDEPFQGLDPVNVELLKALIRELQANGTTIVLSAHEMNLVEALCDRILLINRGKSVLYGELAAIKQQYAPSTVRLRVQGELPDLTGVMRVEQQDQQYILTLASGAHPQAVLADLVSADIEVQSYEVGSAPLEEIFISGVKEETHA